MRYLPLNKTPCQRRSGLTNKATKSRYAAAHVDSPGPRDAQPTALQIMEDEEVVGKLKAKVIIITGTSSGIGIETASAFASTGATLHLTARDVGKAETALADFFEPDRMKLLEMDKKSLESVRKAAAAILAVMDQVSILVNNADIMAVLDL
jgi:cysteine synthase